MILLLLNVILIGCSYSQSEESSDFNQSEEIKKYDSLKIQLTESGLRMDSFIKNDKRGLKVLKKLGPIQYDIKLFYEKVTENRNDVNLIVSEYKKLAPKLLKVTEDLKLHSENLKFREVSPKRLTNKTGNDVENNTLVINCLNDVMAVQISIFNRLYENATQTENGIIIDSNLLARKDVEEIFQKGNYHYGQGEYKTALFYVDSAISIDSKYIPRFAFRATIKESLGMYESAIEDLTICIKGASQHWTHYYLSRGDVKMKMKKYDDALSDYNKSIELKKDNWHSYYARCKLKIKLNQIEEALLDINRTIEINDNLSEVFETRVSLRIKLGDKRGACSDLQQLKEWGGDEYDKLIKENCQQ